MKFRIGATLKDIKFDTTPSTARSLSYDTFQVFLGSAMRIYCTPKTEKVLIGFRDELRKNHVTVVIHGSYTINLCHPESNPKHNKSITALVSLLKQVEVIGKRCMGVIIHMGHNMKENNTSIKESLKLYAEGLKKALRLAPGRSKIVLETGASQGSEVGSRLEQLSEIYDYLDESEKNRVRFCIDSCHIWASGYDIGSVSGVNDFFEQFDRLIGLSRIVCIHFNNSMNPLGSHVDRHADLSFGAIPEEGIREIARYAKKLQIALITETPLVNVTAEEELETMKGYVKD